MSYFTAESRSVFIAVIIILVPAILTLHPLFYYYFGFSPLVFLWLKATENASEYLTPRNIFVSPFEIQVVFNRPFNEKYIGYDHQANPVKPNFILLLQIISHWLIMEESVVQA